MNNRLTNLIAATLAVCALSANAATIITPVSATAPNQLTASRVAANMINGSNFDAVNLTVGTGTDNVLFTSNFLSTSFNDATGQGATSNVLGQAILSSPYLITFDLGQNYDLTGTRFWNWNDGGNQAASVKTMEILVASTVGGSTTSLGTFNPTAGTGSATFGGDLFSTVASDVREVTFSITESFGWGSGNDTLVGINEVRFEVIPEPSTALLGGIGMLLLTRRRRQG